MFLKKTLYEKAFIIVKLVSVIFVVAIYEVNQYLFNCDISITPTVAVITVPITIYLYKKNKNSILKVAATFSLQRLSLLFWLAGF